MLVVLVSKMFVVHLLLLLLFYFPVFGVAVFVVRYRCV